jgi:hypothetical protein
MLQYMGQHGEDCKANPSYRLYRMVRDAIKARVLAGEQLYIFLL